MLIKKKTARCGAVKRFTDERGTELCNKPARIVVIESAEPVVLCDDHARTLFDALRRDLRR